MTKRGAKAKAKASPKRKLATAPKSRPKGGRPSGYRPEFARMAKVACEIGATDKELAEMFGCAMSTFYQWRISHPEFAAALAIGKAVADERVERSLYLRAVGYSFEAEKVFCHEGVVTRAPVVEHVEPNVTAQIFWLKNRRPEDWRDKVDHELTGKDGGAIAMTHRIDSPERPETPEEWVARRQRELSAMGAAAGAAAARN